MNPHDALSFIALVGIAILLGVMAYGVSDGST